MALAGVFLKLVPSESCDESPAARRLTKWPHELLIFARNEHQIVSELGPDCTDGGSICHYSRRKRWVLPLGSDAMRLTLRTMLAYLDNALLPSEAKVLQLADAEALGKKINE